MSSRQHRPIVERLALLSALLAACGGEPTETLGGETSWLQACAEDTDCPEGDGANACVCGFCSQNCAAHACPKDRICVPTDSAAARASCLAGATEPLCLPRCSAGDCRGGYTCRDGACVPDGGVARLAFPSAQGFGARVTGGRGGKLVRVTTLAKDGPGSLGEALALPFPRIIVFEVSGVIEAPSLEIANGDVTIAGQTAPGAGITLAGPLRGRYDASVGNIVIRHLRLRPRYDGSDITQYDALQLSKNHHLMIDHVSAAYAVDETLDILEAQDVTIQWSTIETIDDQDNPTDRFIRGVVAGPTSARISVHHLVCTHNRGSCVSIGGGPAELVNSHFYDVRAAFTHSSAAHGPFNFVGNSFFSGSNQTLLPLVFDDEAPTPAPDLSYFLNDNWLLDTTADCTQGSVDNPWGCTYDVGRGAEFRASTAPDFASIAHSWVPIAITPASDNETVLLTRAGAMPRDAVTVQSFADVRDRTGTLDAPYPAELLQDLVVTAPPVDSDQDGMPDPWERSNGLDPLSPADQNVLLGTGYPAIEEYLNQLANALERTSVGQD